MLSQKNISDTTPMGATPLNAGGATFRAWAPRAKNVYVNGNFGGQAIAGLDPAGLLERNGNYWTGYLASAKAGDLYSFMVEGQGSTGMKRDPYARELATDKDFPACSAVLRSDAKYVWHDRQYVTPAYSDMVLYQIHIGTFNVTRPGVSSTFLDVVERIPYLVALGINMLQPLPVTESEDRPSLGYNGADYFSPDFPYVVTDPQTLDAHLATINGLFAAKGIAAIARDQIEAAPDQLRVLIDLCHVYGIGFLLDVVYNHAGGFENDDFSLRFWDRFTGNDNNDSLYMTDQGYVGGLAFALWNEDVRQFLLDNATWAVRTFHVDGFRYDEIGFLLESNQASGWTFCRDLTDTLRFIKPNLLQNAEFWPTEYDNFPKTTADIVNSTANGGAGFDVVQHDKLRDAIRDALTASSSGAGTQVDMTRIATNLFPPGLFHAWQAVTSVENHDIVKVGTHPRIAALADPSDHRSWYARSRARVASALLLTAPGIPQLFMGQEVLEDKQWEAQPMPWDTVYWDGALRGLDPAMVNHLRFMQDLIRLRWQQPALRGEQVDAFHVHDANRVLAFHRWLEGSGQDVIVVASLADATHWSYGIGFPAGGFWKEVFNSDVYDNWVNPQVAGNGPGITADGPPMYGFQTSANLVIPANGVIVFARG